MVVDQTIKNLWERLNSNEFTPQKRGFEFERIIEMILKKEGLEPKASYKPKGEQVDGSFFCMGQTFLLEAKWTANPIPASAIYAFKGKLDGKFHTSSGVFISVNGYSSDVEDALRFGKSLNVILFLEEDIKLIFSQKVTFYDVLKFKMRQAGDTGQVAVPYNLIKKVENFEKQIPNNRKNDRNVVDETVDLLVVSEFPSDEKIIENYLEPLVNNFEYTYKILNTDRLFGLRLIPAMLSLYEEFGHIKGVLVFTNNNFQGENSESALMSIIKDQVNQASISSKLKVVSIDEQFKRVVQNNSNADWNDIYEKPIYKQTISFLADIKGIYDYDPITDSVNGALEGVIESLRWDTENKIVYLENEEHFGHDTELTTYEDFIYHVNEEVISGAIAYFPLNVIKECGPFDYEEEVIEYLSRNKKKEMEEMGWSEYI